YIIVVLIILTNSCKKNGCTDYYALNFSAQAKKDNGTCKYFADKFLGRYSSTDTSIENSFFGLTHDTTSYIFNIERYQKDTLAITSFFKCSDVLYVNADTSMIEFRNDNFCDRFLAGYLNFNGDTLQYNCWYSNSSSTIHRWGTALKQ